MFGDNKMRDDNTHQQSFIAFEKYLISYFDFWMLAVSEDHQTWVNFVMQLLVNLWAEINQTIPIHRLFIGVFVLWIS